MYPWQCGGWYCLFLSDFYRREEEPSNLSEQLLNVSWFYFFQPIHFCGNVFLEHFRKIFTVSQRLPNRIWILRSDEARELRAVRETILAAFARVWAIRRRGAKWDRSVLRRICLIFNSETACNFRVLFKRVASSESGAKSPPHCGCTGASALAWGAYSACGWACQSTCLPATLAPVPMDQHCTSAATDACRSKQYPAADFSRRTHAPPPPALARTVRTHAHGAGDRRFLNSKGCAQAVLVKTSYHYNRCVTKVYIIKYILLSILYLESSISYILSNMKYLVSYLFSNFNSRFSTLTLRNWDLNFKLRFTFSSKKSRRQLERCA